MPASITHLIVQQKLAKRLRDIPGGTQFADLLDLEPASPFTGFGSIGPDFLFFSLREYGFYEDLSLEKFLNVTFKLYDVLQPFVEFRESVVVPIENRIEDVIDAIDETIFNGIFNDFRQIADLVKSSALSLAGTLATNNFDLFYLFYPQVQLQTPERQWYWFDFLHYRKTGTFCSNMWQLAQGDQDLMRYVLGYASHIGTDVVGHSYVNSIVGGPYRMHWRRHKLVENWIDAYARDHYGDSEAIAGLVAHDERDEPEPDEVTAEMLQSVSGSNYYRLCRLTVDGTPRGDEKFEQARLPEKLGKMLLAAMEITFPGNNRPHRYNFDDLEQTYLTWLTWFKRATTIGDAIAPTPVPPPAGVAAAVALVGDFANSLPPPPGGGGIPSGSAVTIENIFAAMVTFVEWMGEVIDKAFQWIAEHAEEILALPAIEMRGMIKWLLYQIHQGMWLIYENLRFNFVLQGYLYPEKRDLVRNPWGKALVNTSFADFTGGGKPSDSKYPRKQMVPVKSFKDSMENLVATAFTTGNEYHLRYPVSKVENPVTEPTPKPLQTVFPEVFIDGVFPYDPFIESLYSAFDPNATQTIDTQTRGTPQFGSALDLSARLIAERINELPNFNLDSDRGYGWKVWQRDADAADKGGPSLDSFDPLTVTSYLP